MVKRGATTFGQLAIGDRFEWRDTAEIQSGPPGPEPMVKWSLTGYSWSKGYGTAEPHYPVRRIGAHNMSTKKTGTTKKTRATAKPDAALRRTLRQLTAENKHLKALLTANNIIWGG